MNNKFKSNIFDLNSYTELERLNTLYCNHGIIVVYAYRNEDTIRIISARKATTKEAKEYEKRIQFFKS